MHLATVLHMLQLLPSQFKPSPGTAISTIPRAESEPGLLPFGFNPPALDASKASNIPPECIFKHYNPGPLSDQTFPPFDAKAAQVYRYRQQQSVNLGSWFVHEAWMTPSVFACASGKKISELDIAYGWYSTDTARSVLEHHWDTFITISDFEYLASIGINTVRIPIGYWNLGPAFCENTPFAPVSAVYKDSWSRIVRAINQAAVFGIGVLIDLHGAAGSQNGQPHSGISDKRTNLFGNEGNMAQTIKVLTFLTKELCEVTNVVGIQILNEPQNDPSLVHFYTRAITAMRQISGDIPLYIHDGFDLQRFSKFVASRNDFIVQDHHSYFVFTPSDASEPGSDHTQDVKSSVSGSLAAASTLERRNLIIGEWSCALTPQSLANDPDQDATSKNFCTTQLDVYRNVTAGWSFWSYMLEACADNAGWCFKAAVGNSLPSTFYSYGQPPSFASYPLIQNLELDPLSALTTRSQEKSLYTNEPLSRRHRHAYIHQRRQSNQDALDPSADRSSFRGYTDGFSTAKTFAAFSGSKLGFIPQFIDDKILALGASEIEPGTEDSYRDAFLQGLAMGQSMVEAVL